MPKLRDWYTKHKGNIIKETRIARAKLMPGHIVRFNYPSNENPRPIVIVLNPRWKNKLHAITLKNVPERVVSLLVKETKLAYSRKLNEADSRELETVKLDSTLSEDPRKFYYTKLKRFLHRYMDGTHPCYRTYDIAKIKAINLIEYEFKDSDVEKYYIGEEDDK